MTSLFQDSLDAVEPYQRPNMPYPSATSTPGECARTLPRADVITHSFVALRTVTTRFLLLTHCTRIRVFNSNIHVYKIKMNVCSKHREMGYMNVYL